MARGILVTYSGYPYSMNSMMPDNGLANLAGALYTAGHEALVLDYGTVPMIQRLFPESVRAALCQGGGQVPDMHALSRELEIHTEQVIRAVCTELCDVVRSYQPDFVGFKLWNGDGCSGSITLARALRREFPQIKLFGGGPHIVFAIKPLIERTGHFEPLEDGTFDVLMQSEAEHLIHPLAEFAVGKRPLSSISNTLYAENGAVQINPVEHVPGLDALAAPLYDTEVYPSMEGNQKLHILTLDESRGCVFNCNFCAHPLITGHRLRLRSAVKIVEEMERCIHAYGIGAFRFAGSATPGNLLEKIADELLARGLKVRYTAFGRVNYSRPEAFARMRQSGLQSLFFGVESGSQRILDQAMNKQVRVEDMRRVLKASRAAGIFTAGSLIAPAPGETEETWQETVNLLRDVQPDSVIISPPGIVPGTAWYNNRSHFGIHIGKNYEEEVYGLKFKNLFPADQWDWPEYSVGGKTSRTLAAECTQMIKQVESMGLLSMFSDDMYLMSRYCSLPPRDFRDQTQRWLCGGDWEAVGNLVAEMNSNVHTEAREQL